MGKIKVSDQTEVKTEEKVVEIQKSTRKTIEKIRGKKYLEMRKKYDHAKLFTPSEAVKLVKEISYSKFKGTVEAHLVLKKSGVTAQVTLPFLAGKTKKVEVVSDATIEKLKAGNVDFDILVATPDMMPKLVPYAKLLGPRGLMPNPKNGTLVSDLKKAQGFSTATITIKTEKEAPLVHTVIGKIDQKDTEIIANLEAIMQAIGGVKQIVRVYIKSSMSPSIKVQI